MTALLFPTKNIFSIFARSKQAVFFNFPSKTQSVVGSFFTEECYKHIIFIFLWHVCFFELCLNERFRPYNGNPVLVHFRKPCYIFRWFSTTLLSILRDVPGLPYHMIRYKSKSRRSGVRSLPMVMTMRKEICSANMQRLRLVSELC